MSLETNLSGKLRRFNSLDLVLVILVYFTVSLLIASNYMPLSVIDWWFYLILAIVCVFPLVVHLISQPGDSFHSKFQACVKSNQPALQVLLFLTTFFLGCLANVLLPVLSEVPWWVYLVLIVVLAIKPLQKNWFW